MTTLPYSDLLAQVEALAGATLATAEQARVKIFANRRARKAHRECDYWPHLLHVGEERIVSDTGLLPLAQTGLDTIDKIIRIHAEDPFKSQAVYEYTEYYEDANGIQITGYQPNATGAQQYIVTGELNPDLTGTYDYLSTDSGLYPNIRFQSTSNSLHQLLGVFDTGVGAVDSWILIRTSDFSRWESEAGVATPDLATTWTPAGSETGTPTVTAAENNSAYITYIAAPAVTYGDGDGEESDVPEPWFEYMAQGAYCDWLRSDGQTEKAMAEEAIAADLLNQQLEKVSRQNGNQVVTRMMSHATKQSR